MLRLLLKLKHWLIPHELAPSNEFLNLNEVIFVQNHIYNEIFHTLSSPE